MSISELIAPQLPYLRRFARVLSGSQASGDAYVVAMLEAIAAEPKMFPAEIEPRVATYRTFLKVWNSVRLNHQTVDAATSERLAAADRKLEAITPRARQAFLLMAVEEFSTADTAEVLETDEAGVKALVDQAASEIAEQVATNVLIIEDEPMIAIDLDRSRHRPRPRRLRDGPHRQGGGGALPQAPAGSRPRRHPARRRQLGARCGQRDP